MFTRSVKWLCWKLPGLRELVDYADLYALIAPRPLQCQNGRREGPTDFWVPLARGAMEDVRQAYTDLGRPGNAELVIREGGHEIDLPSLLRAFSTRSEPVAWFSVSAPILTAQRRRSEGRRGKRIPLEFHATR